MLNSFQANSEIIRHIKEIEELELDQSKRIVKMTELDKQMDEMLIEIEELKKTVKRLKKILKTRGDEGITNKKNG